MPRKKKRKFAPTSLVECIACYEDFWPDKDEEYAMRVAKYLLGGDLAIASEKETQDICGI
jgi:hypothetical protein